MPTEAERLNEGQRFVRQTSIDTVVERALNAIDKPDVFTGDPANAFRGWIERDRSLVVDALTRCRKLAKDNPRDFVAVGAVQLLESVLAATP